MFKQKKNYLQIVGVLTGFKTLVDELTAFISNGR